MWEPPIDMCELRRFVSCKWAIILFGKIFTFLNCIRVTRFKHDETERNILVPYYYYYYYYTPVISLYM